MNLADLNARLKAESSRYAAASPEARERMNGRLQNLRQLLAEEKARQSQYLPPRECLCLK